MNRINEIDNTIEGKEIKTVKMTTKIYFNDIDLSSKPIQIDKEAPHITIQGTKEQAVGIAEQLLFQGIVESYVIPSYYHIDDIYFE